MDNDLEHDLRRARELLAKGKTCPYYKPDHNTECLHCDDWSEEHGELTEDEQWQVYRLFASFVEAIDQFRVNQEMLARVLRNTVLAIGDVPDDWEGSVEAGVGLINVNVARMNAAADEQRIEIGRLRAVDAQQRDHLAALMGRNVQLLAEQMQFYGLFSDYEEPCTSFEMAQAIWNDRKRREGIEREEMRRLRAQTIAAEGLIRANFVVIEEQRAEIARLRERALTLVRACRIGVPHRIGETAADKKKYNEAVRDVIEKLEREL